MSHTPGPCGCTTTAWRMRHLHPTIVYCPLHAAAPQGLDAAGAAYLALLRSGWSYRLKVQSDLCMLRDYIAAATGREAQDVQDEYEARALLARLEGKGVGG